MPLITFGERAQRAIGHNMAGKVIINAFSGSSSPGTVRGDWYSNIAEPEINSVIKVAGNPNAGWLARNWNTAMIMATPLEELVALYDEVNSAEQRHAVAYVTDDIVHVGIRAKGHTIGFGKINEREDRAVALRLGRGPLEATMGVWLPDERTFVSVSSVRVVETDCPVSAVGSKNGPYPSVSLVI
jgi:hypothetical protein